MKIVFPLLLLFVARSALSSNWHGSIILFSHSDEPTEGDTVELTCNIASTSSPSTNRKKLYYRWTFSDFDDIVNFYSSSNGPAVDTDGNIRPGYSFKNDGRTLVIDSVRRYLRYSECRGSEDGETYSSIFRYCLQIRHKPYIRLGFPDINKFNAAINKIVLLDFLCEAYPPYSPKGSWTFVNFDGVSKCLPLNSEIKFQKYDCSSECSLRFNFASAEYYGNYSFNMTNDLGSATITFQVLPEGPPDAPSNVRIQNVTDNTIVVEWTVMWSNSYDGRQTVCWQLIQAENGTILESSYTSYDYNFDYNKTYRSRFEKNIQPETNYKVRAWSINKFGKSQIVQMEVERQKYPNLIFTTETISINKTEAIVNLASPPPISLWVILGITSAALIAGLLATW